MRPANNPSGLIEEMLKKMTEELLGSPALMGKLMSKDGLFNPVKMLAMEKQKLVDLAMTIEAGINTYASPIEPDSNLVQDCFSDFSNLAIVQSLEARLAESESDGCETMNVSGSDYIKIRTEMFVVFLRRMLPEAERLLKIGRESSHSPDCN
jgi:hypothetical protein